MLYGHGDDRYQYKANIRADFSSNIRNDCLPEGLKDYLFSHWESLVSHYPEPLGESLQRKISHNFGIDYHQVLPCNGTVEAIYLLAHYYAGAKSAVLVPTFSEYEDAARLYNHQLEFISREEASANSIDFYHYDLVFICNPNNPTGQIFNPEEIQQWIRKNPRTCFVIDEAYFHFVAQPISTVNFLQQFNNLVILRSLTKTYSLPGLRLGYMLGSKKIIQDITGLKPPWTVNSLAMEAGCYIFDQAIPLPPVHKMLDQAFELYNKINALPGYECRPSKTHFLLCYSHNHQACRLKQKLLEQYGILIRDAGNFRGLTGQYFRISVQSPSENQLLIDALMEIS